MSISMVTNDELGILEVTYSADPLTDADLAEQRRLVAEAISRSNISKVLLDATLLPGFPSILTSLEHNKAVAANDQLRRTKFAVVCPSLGEDERSLETTGVNRGVNMKCFISRAEGLAWLG